MPRCGYDHLRSNLPFLAGLSWRVIFIPTQNTYLTSQKKDARTGHLFFDIRIYAYLTLNTPLFILSFIELIDLLL